MAEKKPVLLVIEDDPGLQAQLKWAYDDFEVVFVGDRASALTALPSPDSIRCNVRFSATSSACGPRPTGRLWN